MTANFDWRDWYAEVWGFVIDTPLGDLDNEIIVFSPDWRKPCESMNVAAVLESKNQAGL